MENKQQADINSLLRYHGMIVRCRDEIDSGHMPLAVAYYHFIPSNILYQDILQDLLRPYSSFSFENREPIPVLVDIIKGLKH